MTDTPPNQQQQKKECKCWEWINHFLAWIGKQFSQIARITIALLLVTQVAVPIACTITEKQLSARVTEFIPENVVETLTNLEGKEVPKAQGENQNASHTGAAEKSRITTETGGTSRVWAYGIQTVGLLATLAITLWAVVALVQSD